MDIFVVNFMVVFVVAVLSGIVLRFFGLPSIIGHVLAGFLIGLSGIVGGESVEVLRMFGSLGITLLLFMVGLEMNLAEIKQVGKKVTGMFLGQSLFLITAFTLIATFVLKMSALPSLLIAIAFTFSSTIVVVKVLSEKKDLNSYIGKMTLGILLLQDMLAIILLVFLPNLTSGIDFYDLGILILKFITVLITVNVIGHYLVNLFLKKFIKTSEDLILFSLVWLLLVIFYSTSILKLSPEVGGFLAGLSLSTSWGHYQIVSKVRTLRDIFLTIFFVLLGLEVGGGKASWSMVVLMIALIIIGKFALTHLWARIIGLNGRIAFKVALNLTQISEFSLIVMSIGLSSGMWDETFVKSVTMAGLFSMAMSTILTMNTDRIYKSLIKICPFLFKFPGEMAPVKTELKNHIVLFGGDRTGRSVLSMLEKNGEKLLVVDFNPAVVKKLRNRGVDAIFSDATDPDVIELANLPEAKMIISTIKDAYDSLTLLEELNDRGIKVPVVADAETPVQAKELYEKGARYVIFPHFVSGLHLGQLIKKYGKDKTTIEVYRDKQNETLKEIYEGEFK